MVVVRVLSNPQSAARRFAVLADDAERIRIATAWATDKNPVTATLRRHHDKIDAIAVGIAFGNTDPKFLRRFRDKVRVVLPSDGVTFHPKVYLFIRSDRFDAIIGSSNLTSGGFNGNLEANLWITGRSDEALLGDIEQALDELSEGGVAVSRAILAECETQWRAWRRLKAGAAKPVSKEPSPGRASTPASLFISWSEFYNLLLRHESLGHDLIPTAKTRGYLGVITEIRRIFKQNGTLSAMNSIERDRVAGLSRDEFATYGSTYMVGYFANIVRTRPQLVDRALSRIPASPIPITLHHFQQFVKHLPNTSGFGSTGVGSRLLAMKRPDLFIGINSKNGPGLAREFGLAPSTLNHYSNLWRLYEAIWSCPWHRSLRPRGKQGAFWDARVALLDALFYRP